MARRNNKSNTFRRFSDALKLLVELGDYPQHMAAEKLVCALARAPRSTWKAKFKGHPVPDLWKRLSGSGEGKSQFAVDPHYEENWIEAHDARGPYTVYGIQVADKVLLPLLPPDARALLSERQGALTNHPKRWPKHKARQGAEPQFDRPALRDIAEEARKAGPDKHRAWFYDRVRGLCREHRPPIKAPTSDRTMGRYIGDLYHPSADSCK